MFFHRTESPGVLRGAGTITTEYRKGIRTESKQKIM